MNEFEKQEEKVRNRFISDFGQYFKTIEKTDYYANVDLIGKDFNGIEYQIELKERSEKYSIKNISGATFIEKIKLNYFDKTYKENNNIELLYFNYFSDGYISYRMNKRYEEKTSEVYYTFPIYISKTTVENNGNKIKMMGSLSANLSNDKLKQY